MKKKLLYSAVMLSTFFSSTLLACNKEPNNSQTSNSEIESVLNSATPSENPSEVFSEHSSEEPSVLPSESQLESPSEEVSEKESESELESPSEEVSEKESESVVVPAEKLETPVINVDENGISYSAVENASSIKMKIDNGEYEEISEIKFSEEPGIHTITVKAFGDQEHYIDSNEISYSYETKNVDISVSKVSATSASIEFVGFKAYANDVEIDGSSYKADKTGNIEFKVIGGVDLDNSVYYVGSDTQTVNFTCPSIDDYIVEDATEKESADLVDSWAIKVYKDGWVDTKATVGVENVRDNNVIVMNAWNNTNVYRYSVGYDVNDGYTGLSFDMKGDDIANVKVQLMNTDSGVYATYDLTTLSSNWSNFVIDIDDENWKINLQGKDYKLADVAAQIGAYDSGEIIKAFNQINFIINGSTANGSTTKLYLDNLTLESSQIDESSIVPNLYRLTDNYVSSVNNINYRLAMNSNGTGHLETLNLSQIDPTKEELSFDVTTEINGDLVTVKDTATNGQTITFTGKFTLEGEKATVISSTGALSSYLNNASFVKSANVLLDFEDGTGNSAYTNSLWSQQYYGSDWVNTTGKMNSRYNPSKTSKVVNFYTGSNVTYLYKYNNNGTTLGLADYAAIDLGNYFSGATNMSIKLSVMDTKGTLHYLLGDANSFNTFPVTTDLMHLEKYFDQPIEVKFIQLAVKSSLSSAYLYADNLELSFKGRAEENKNYTFDVNKDAGIASYTAYALSGNDLTTAVDVTEAKSFEIAENKNLALSFTVKESYEIVSVKIGETAAQVVSGYYIFSASIAGNYTIVVTTKQLTVTGEILKLDFEDGTAGSDYTNSKWTYTKYTSDGWVAGGKMRCRMNPENTSKVVNLQNGWGITYNYVYNENGTSLGTANFVSIDVGNYFSGAEAVNIKISVIDTNGTKHYILGDASTFYSFGVTTTLETLSANISPIEIKSITITTRSNKSGDAYLYIDNLKLENK